MKTAMNESLQRTCKWCKNEIPSNKRSDAQYCSDSCRYSAHNQDECIYCGRASESRDHVIPRRMREVLELRYGPSWTRFFDVPDTVPCCLECNSIAGAKLFPTVSAKRRFIHKRLKEKYKKLIEAPNWEQEEIDELGPSLKSHIKGLTLAKIILEERLSWSGYDVNKSNRIRRNDNRKYLEAIARKKKITLAEVIQELSPKHSLIEINMLLEKHNRKQIEEGYSD